jgi:hypothetical protein
MLASSASIAGALVLALGCSGLQPSSPEPPADPAEIEHTIFLLGDAGHPRRGGEPVFDALARVVPEDSTRATLVFLGDNIYPRGLPAEGDI